MQKHLLWVLFLCMSFVTPVSTFADHGKEWKKGKKKMDWGTKDLLAHKVFFKANFYLKNAEKLSLTEEQMAKIKEIKLNLQKEMLRNNAEIKAAKLDLANELHKEKLDSIKIPSLIDKEYELKKKLGKEAVKALIQIKSLLTPEQMEKAKELWKKKKRKMKSRYSRYTDQSVTYPYAT